MCEHKKMVAVALPNGQQKVIIAKAGGNTVLLSYPNGEAKIVTLTLEAIPTIIDLKEQWDEYNQKALQEEKEADIEAELVKITIGMIFGK